MTTESEPRPTITKVWAKNFRSIEYAELELGPLTVLVGPNASGKSNLLDILGFLADTARHGLETAITRRGGIEFICRKLPKGRSLGPEFGIQLSFPQATIVYSLALRSQGKGEYTVKREYTKLDFTESEADSYEIEIADRRLTKPDLKKLIGPARTQKTEGSVQTIDLVRQLNQAISARDVPTLYLLAQEPLLAQMISYVLSTVPNHERSISSLDFLRRALRLAWQCVRDIGVGNIFPNSLRSPQLVADGRNFASVVHESVKKSRFLPELKESLALAVPGVRDIRIRTIGSFDVVQLKHERNDQDQRSLWLDLLQESDGTLRMLAMLIILFQDPPQFLIGLEEPEQAIHPGAIAVLADTMMEASLRGQILVTTHSPDLINLVPIDSIRAVTAEDGSTRVGRVAEHQLKSVKDNLFLPGELHSMEGLQPASDGKPAE